MTSELRNAIMEYAKQEVGDEQAEKYRRAILLSVKEALKTELDYIKTGLY